MSDVDESVRSFLDGVTPENRRRDAETLLALMGRATGESPRMWGCLYLKDLAEVDLAVLEGIVTESYLATAGHSS